MKDRLRLAICCFFFLIFGQSAHAGMDPHTKIAGHLVPHSAKSLSLSPPACNDGESNLTVEGEVGVPYDLYLLLLDADAEAGVSAVSFGLEYRGGNNGLKIMNWSSEAETQIKRTNSTGDDWPSPGSGNTLIFDSRKARVRQPATNDTDSGVTLTLGRLYVYAYGPDLLEIAPYNDADTTSLIVVGDDTGGHLSQENVGTVSFGQSFEGRDPCADQRGVSQASTRDIRTTVGPVALSFSSPNPFSSTVRWTLRSSEEQAVNPVIFSMSGRRVRSFGSFKLEPGENALDWDGTNDLGRRVASGKYYLRVTGPNGLEITRSVILLQR